MFGLSNMDRERFRDAFKTVFHNQKLVVENQKTICANQVILERKLNRILDRLQTTASQPPPVESESVEPVSEDMRTEPLDEWGMA